MKQWIISKNHYYANLERQKYTFNFPRKLKKNEICLYDKGANVGKKFSYWKLAEEQNPMYDALIIERDNRPKYWRQVIIPYLNGNLIIN